jgi:hypothetical protein
MFKELYLKYPDGRIRLPVGSQFENSFEALDKIPAESDVDMNNSKSGGAIVGAFSELAVSHTEQSEATVITE